MMRSCGARRSKSSEKLGLSQVVISACAVRSFRLSAGVIVRAAVPLPPKQARQSPLLRGRKKRCEQVLAGADNEMRTRHAGPVYHRFAIYSFLWYLLAFLFFQNTV